MAGDIENWIYLGNSRINLMDIVKNHFNWRKRGSLQDLPFLQDAFCAAEPGKSFGADKLPIREYHRF